MTSLALVLRNPGCDARLKKRRAIEKLRAEIVMDLMLDKSKRDRKAEDSTRFRKTGE